ncbi:MAG: phosphoribosylglycinamide formyltransferase [Deltaproteobacteria bacterium]|nr:phosphoribosylglycinamide formyltransferase [Deltaproteobacteria bacterium]
MKEKSRLGILVSGNGTNLQAILDAADKPDYPAEVAMVVSNVPKALALDRAGKKGIPTALVPHQKHSSREDFENEMIQHLDRVGVHLVVLAGFMRVLSPTFIRHYRNRILNIHPALLPAFPGTHAIQQAWDYGVKVTGVTVHFVNEGTDTGPIILQKELPLQEGEDLKKLEERIHTIEHQLYPEAIRLFCERKLEIKGRKVFIGKTQGAS